MSTLHDRLADLAARAGDDPAAGVPAGELWTRGRRYGRSRRAGAAVLVVAAVVALVAGRIVVAAVQPIEIAPAGSAAELRLPDRLFVPDPWTPDTDEVGPIGPLVAIVGAPRARWGSLAEHADLAGVDGAGEYAFLALDDRTGDDLALSPDGRHLAYWYAEDAADVPGAATEKPADGVAVLDTVAGTTERYAVDSPLGLMPDRMTWAGERLWAPLWHYDDVNDQSASSDLASVLVWDLGTGERAETSRDGLAVVGELTAWDGDLVDLRGDRLVRVSPDGERRVVARLGDAELDAPAYVDPSGTRVAVLRNTDPDGAASNRPEPVAVGILGSGGTVELADLPGGRVDRIVGWRSDHELVTYRFGEGGVLYEVVDVLTGAREQLVELPAESSAPNELVAADALAAPVFAAPEPPDLRDPRLVLAAGAGTGLAAIALGLVGLALWRRRVRA